MTVNQITSASAKEGGMLTAITLLTAIGVSSIGGVGSSLLQKRIN